MTILQRMHAIRGLDKLAEETHECAGCATGRTRPPAATCGSLQARRTTSPMTGTACERLARAGISLRADRDEAWRSFGGWRVNYDAVLVALAALTMAPYAPWSSDRSTTYTRPSYMGRYGSRSTSRRQAL